MTLQSYLSPPNGPTMNPEKYRNLPLELQHKILRMNRNCGQFVKGLQPFRTENLDDYPDARRFFRKTVLYSLKQFCNRVSSLKLYKRSTIHPTSTWRVDGSPMPALPLITRIYQTIQEIEADPDMTGRELAERCKRISDWKHELVQMPTAVRNMVRHFDNFRASYAQNPSTARLPPHFGGKIEIFTMDPDSIFEPLVDDSYGSMAEIADFPTDVMNNIDQLMQQEIQTEIPHDNQRLKSVLQPIV